MQPSSNTWLTLDFYAPALPGVYRLVASFKDFYGYENYYTKPPVPTAGEVVIVRGQRYTTRSVENDFDNNVVSVFLQRGATEQNIIYDTEEIANAKS